jgi:hypothetical protein
MVQVASAVLNAARAGVAEPDLRPDGRSRLSLVGRLRVAEDYDHGYARHMG